MKISDAAKLLGISTDTIRYYEKEGVITPKRTSKNNYRDLDNRDIISLLICIYNRKIGYSMKESVEYVEGIPVSKITDILNEKTFTPILKEEFDINYSDSNHIVKFWLSTYIDPEDSKVNFYPYNIFIDTNLNLYVAAGKKGDLRYLKSSITEDEYRVIVDSYNTLFKEKEVA